MPALSTAKEYAKHYGPRFLLRKAVEIALEMLEGVVRTVLRPRMKRWRGRTRTIFDPVSRSPLEKKVRILGNYIDLDSAEFTRDPVTGRAFPKHHYKLLRHELRFFLFKKYGKEGTDVKRAWDLSRLQFLLAKPTEDNYEYAKSIVQKWLAENPYEIGINWATPMEVSIRAINLVLFYHLYREFLKRDREFRKRLLDVIYSHGDYLWRNRRAEWGPVRSNHYLSDVLGLFILGAFLNKEEWHHFGRSELEKEMKVQVWEDGVSWEVSTNYHRLNTEIFTIAAVVAKNTGNPFPEWWMEKLHKMHLFIAWITKPDGLAPLIGDVDNGRIIDPELNRDRRDFRDVLDVGTVLFKDGRLKLRKKPGPLLGLLLGKAGLKEFQKIKQEPLKGVKHFKKSGYVVVKDGDFFFITRCGPMGLKGTGGHAHNDLLSFELYDGEDIIVDPGMPCYTSCPKKRNLYRSTKMHNTVIVDGMEQNTITEDMFKLFQEVERTAIAVAQSKNAVRIRGEYRMKPGIVHRRTFSISMKEHLVEITDEITGGKKKVEAVFLSHRRPRIAGSKIMVGNFSVSGSKKAKIAIEETEIATEYGKTNKGYRTVFRYPLSQPHIVIETKIKKGEIA